MLISSSARPVRATILALCFLGFLASVRSFTGFGGTSPMPPETKRENFIEEINGVEISDPYRWLEDGKSAKTRAWIEEQNKYFQDVLSQLPGREKIKARISELMKIDTVGMPTERGGRYFFSKRSAEEELSKVYFREGVFGEDKLLLDPFSFAEDGSISVGLEAVSKDGKLIAYSLRKFGADEVDIHLLDVDTLEDLPDKFINTRFTEMYLTPDKTGIYYTNHTDRGPRLYYHKIGTNTAQDVLIFGDAYGPEDYISIYLTEDGKYLLISVGHGWVQNELYLMSLDGAREIKTLVSGIRAIFSGFIGAEKLFILTNQDAPNWKVFATTLSQPEMENWREIIPESGDSIEHLSLAGGKLFIGYLHNVASRLKAFDAEGHLLYELELPAIGSVSGMSGRWDSEEAFYSFSSFHIPPTIYRYDTKTNASQVWFRQQCPIDVENFEAKQVWYASKDGTRIPMFIVHRKRLELNGDNPTLLTGYGGFNVSLKPYFIGANALWLENGGVFAMPNLRGGGEFGEKWHKAGMLENKQNTFDDFISAAEWLIENRYTNPEKLAISGGSNGGLLIGAALTQRPELFRAAVCTYPLLDMLRYDKFLVGSLWTAEYGDPDNPENFEYLFAYSPYHNVRKGVAYPAVLFVTGDFDTRVDPMHARKMTALLQWATASDPAEKPILLSYDTKAGHSGGLKMSEWIEREADEFLFLFWQLGISCL